MNVDPEIKRKAEDLKRPPPEEDERDANEERRHLEAKAEEIIDKAAADKRSGEERS